MPPLLTSVPRGGDCTDSYTEFPKTRYTGSPVSEKNCSRKPGEQARLPTPRYRIGMWVYGWKFPRRGLLVSSVNKPLRSGRHLLRLPTLGFSLVFEALQPCAERAV